MNEQTTTCEAAAEAEIAAAPEVPAASAEAGTPAAETAAVDAGRSLLERFLAAQARYLRYRALRRAAEAAKAEFPELDFDAALDDPDFVRLIRAGVDPGAAWAVLHRQELAQDRRAAQARSSAETRPAESAVRPAAAALYRTDPKKLTRQQRKELRRRASRGETVTLE